MSKLQVVITCKPDFVWTFLLTPEQWITWWPVAVVRAEPAWETNAEIMWSDGTQSQIQTLERNRKLDIAQVINLALQPVHQGKSTLVQAEFDREQTPTTVVAERLDRLKKSVEVQERVNSLRIPIPNDPVRLETDHGELEELTRVMAILEASGNTGIPRLIEALRYKDYHVLTKAADVLGKLKAQQALRPLIALLEDSRPDVRKAALSALCSIAGTQVGTDLQSWEAWLIENEARRG